MNRLEQIEKPLIIAHRGASAHAPENTLAAFRLAAEQGAGAIELDVKLSRDGEVVVMHDHSLKRTTGKPGEVNQFTLRELKELDAGRHFSDQFRGERIPTLGEVFKTIGKSLLINVELTNYTTPRDCLVEKVADIVGEMSMEEVVFFSSFRRGNLKKIRQLLPECPTAILASPGIAGLVNRSWIGREVAPKIVHPHFLTATPEYIQHEHQKGRRVHVWTVNDPGVMRSLFRLKIDGIFTDDPILAREVRSQC